MKNSISFRTSIFKSGDLITATGNDHHWGEDLAKWLSAKAQGSEFEFGPPVRQLHGWSETVAANGENFDLGFEIADGYVGTDYVEWQITIDKRRKWNMFGSKDSPSRGRLCDLVHNILRDDREIREVQWSE